MLGIVIIILLAFVSLGLGLFVLVSNARNATNISFFGMVAGVSTWAVLNQLSIASPSSLALIRAVMVAALISETAFYLFAKTYPDVRFNLSTLHWATIASCTIAISYMATTDIVFYGFPERNGPDELVQPLANPGIAIYGFYALFLTISGLLSLRKKAQEASYEQKANTKFLYYSQLSMRVPIVLFNFILPATLGVVSLIFLAPFIVLAFLGVSAYAMLSYNLLNVRAVAARFLAYTMTLVAMLLVLYVFAVVVALSLVEATGSDSAVVGVTVIIALISGFGTRYVKLFFDRLTDRYFYQDNYHIRTVIDELGDELIEEKNPDQLLRRASAVINRAIKASTLQIIVRSEDVHSKLIFEFAAAKSKTHDYFLMREMAETRFKQLLKKYDAQLAKPMLTSGHLVGIILLGEKQNGAAFTRKDFELLDICAKNIALALENSRRYAHVSELNERLSKEVTLAKNDLKESNDRLTELTSAKDEFISIASHQLRTPLTAVKSYAALLGEGKIGTSTKRQLEALQTINISIDRMVLMIAELLNVSRLTSDSLKLETATTELRHLVKTEAERFMPFARQKGVKLEIKPGRKKYHLELDEPKFRDALANIIDNAILYTQGEKRVVVSLHEETGNPVIEVSSTGKPIEKGDAKNIFRKYYRGEGAREVRPDGTGLGLYVSRKIFSMHGAQLKYVAGNGVNSFTAKLKRIDT